MNCLDFNIYCTGVHLGLMALGKKGRPGQFYSVRNVYDKAGKISKNNLHDVGEVGDILEEFSLNEHSGVIIRSNPNGFRRYRFDYEKWHKEFERKATEGAKEIAELMKMVVDARTIPFEIGNKPTTI